MTKPTETEVIAQFRAAMIEAGFTAPTEIDADGEKHRFATSGRGKDDAGVYCLYYDDYPRGWFADWRTSFYQDWQFDVKRELTPEERAAYGEAMRKARAEREKEQEARRAEAKKKASALWKAATAARPDHPYLARKGVAPVETLREIDLSALVKALGYTPKSKGEDLTGRVLVAPVKVGRALSTCELIDAAGRKSAIHGGGKAGGMWAAPMPDDVLIVYIGEGVATVLSVREACGDGAFIAALSSGNLKAVALAMRARFKKAWIVLLADLIKKTGEPDEHAIEAAALVGGVVAVPDFGPERASAQTDFNDLHQAQGLEAVQRCIFEAIQALEQGAQASTNPEASAGPWPGFVANLGVLPEDESPDTVKTFKYGSARFESSGRGVFFVRTDEEGNDKPPLFICSPLAVLAKTRNTINHEWGRLLEWHDPDGVKHQWAVPMSMMEGEGLEFRKALADRGLIIASGRHARELLLTYIKLWPTDRVARSVGRLGWHDGVYVTAAECIGDNGEIIVFQNEHGFEPAFSLSGSIEDWRRAIAARAAGNTRLVFAISSAFAGSLVHLAGIDSGGFHLLGKSSSGKSAALQSAASVWGHHDAYAREWRATANGLEGLAALHNDGLLILDELSQMDPRGAGEAAYLLANGQGKTRASKTGAAKQAATWRTLVLSAGEESLAALMAKAGIKANAGQEIRLADIEADAGAGMGLFEAIHNMDSANLFAELIKREAGIYYGAVGVAWLRFIVADRDNLPDILQNGIASFTEEWAPANAGGQVLRVSRRFGLTGMAGELATHYGLTGWPEGEALNSAGKCFTSWAESFGSTGNREERALLDQVRAFFEAHGASRFEAVDATSEQRVPNRAGYFRYEGDAKEFLVFPQAFANELCSGHNPKHAAESLIAAGWMEPGHGARPSQTLRIHGAKHRFYVFNGNMWCSDE